MTRAATEQIMTMSTWKTGHLAKPFGAYELIHKFMKAFLCSHNSRLCNFCRASSLNSDLHRFYGCHAMEATMCKSQTLPQGRSKCAFKNQLHSGQS